MVQDKITLILATIVLLSGCYSEADICSTYISYQKDISYNIVLKSKKQNGRQVHLYGYNPVTLNEESYFDDVSDYYSNAHLMEIGDTILKNKNEMEYRIKKKDSTIVIHMACYKRIV